MDTPAAADMPASPDPGAPPVTPDAHATDASTPDHPGQAAIDLTVEVLEAQDEARWHGRLVAAMTDAELATAERRGEPAAPPPDLPAPRNREPNWLRLQVMWPQKRLSLHLRVDEIVVEWFRRGGPGFQARMNAVLRAYVEAQIEAENRKR